MGHSQVGKVPRLGAFHHPLELVNAVGYASEVGGGGIQIKIKAGVYSTNPSVALRWHQMRDPMHELVPVPFLHDLNSFH